MATREQHQFNFKNAVEQLASPEVGKKPLLPVYEAVHNSIQSIQLAKREKGTIAVKFIRDENDMEPQRIIGIEISDNGLGFTPENLKSFSQLFTDQKKEQFNCKGIGRLAYFTLFFKVKIQSVYENSGKLFEIAETVTENNFYELSQVQATEAKDTEIKTTILLTSANPTNSDLLKISQVTVKNEVTQHFIPSSLSIKNVKIKIIDGDEYYLDDSIQNVSKDTPVVVGKSVFEIYHLKNKSPHRGRHKFILSADGRSVKEHPFSFLPSGKIGENDDKYYLNTVVISDYLNKKLNAQRSDFNIPKSKGFPGGEADLESITDAVTNQARKYSQDNIKKLEDVQDSLINRVFEDLPHLAVLKEDSQVRKGLKLGDDAKTVKDAYVKRFAEKQVETFNYVKTISKKYESNEIPNFDEFQKESLKKLEAGMKLNHAPLISYIKYRDFVLRLYDKLLEKRDDNKYQPEQILHDLLFPTTTNSSDPQNDYFNHNLWLIDDRYAVYDFVSSDQKECHISDAPYDPKDKRYDIFAAYKDPLGAEHNVFIVELKRTGAPLSESNDPFAQIINYVQRIKNGKLSQHDGKRLNITESTQFFGLVLCDVHGEYFRDYMIEKYDLQKRPDSKSYHTVKLNGSFFLEVMNYENLLSIAHARNKVFIDKLHYKSSQES